MILPIVIIAVALKTPFKKRYHWVFIAFAAAISIQYVFIIWVQMAADTAASGHPAEFLARAPFNHLFGYEDLGTALLSSFVLLYLYPKPTSIQRLKLIAPYFYVACYTFILLFYPSQIVTTPVACTGHLGDQGCSDSGGLLYTTYLAPNGVYLFTLVMSVLMLSELLKRYRSEDSIAKRQMKWLAAGIVAFGYGTFAFNVNRYFVHNLGTHVLGLATPSLPQVICCTILIVGLTRHGLYFVTPVTETAPPQPIPARYALQVAHSYLVRDHKASFEAFSEAVRGGRSGLCITRTFPDEVRKAYGLQTTPIRWLAEEKNADAIAPTDLVGLSLTVKDFIEKADKPIVLLHGVEYLIRINSSGPILRLIDGLNDTNATKGGVLLLPVLPEALDKRDDALLVSETSPLPAA